MPIYTYECEQCKLRFDEIVSYEKRSEKQTCPTCNATTGVLDATPAITNISKGQSFSRMRYGK